MREQAHSRTAEVTAAIRACHLLHGDPVLFTDPYALHLTSPLWRTIARSRVLHRLIVRGLFRSLLPVHGWILARDLVTDRVLETFVRTGQRQFVLLGAGFDSTALRRPDWLREVRVFELDHPSTQAVKLNRLARIAQAGEAGFEAGFEPLSIDFERERVVDVLARSSYHAGAGALFAWQGVVYYLSAPAIRHTLDGIAAAAAPGSELLLDFLLPEYTLGRESARTQTLAGRFTARLGERYISFHTVEEMAQLLAGAGFELVDVYLDRDLESTYFGGRRDGLTVMRGFAIAHARRRA